MEPEEWRTLVGVRIEKRRQALGLSVRAAAAGAQVSEGLWRTIESGRRQAGQGVYFTVNPKADTRRRVCRVLNWSADSIDRLLKRQKPMERDYSGRGLWGRPPGEVEAAPSIALRDDSGVERPNVEARLSELVDGLKELTNLVQVQLDEMRENHQELLRALRPPTGRGRRASS